MKQEGPIDAIGFFNLETGIQKKVFHRWVVDKVHFM